VIGETIGNFKIASLLGRGGMGEVYLAHQTSIGTRVAVKVLLAEVSSDTSQVQRFFNEARAVSLIKHSGIVRIFDVGFHSSGRAYLIMEHLEGESLGDRLRRVHRLPLAEVVDIGRQIASVLHATHTAGITHRDLKPDNVFLCPDSELPTGERVKILDFGIAKLTGVVSGKVPNTVGTMGTPTYMAPEQWGDSAKVDWRADAYSLGCLIYEIACGQPPFLGDTFAELYVKHLTTVPVSIKLFDGDLPSSLDSLLQHLLAKLPAERPGSMAEVVRAFDAIRTARGPFDQTVSADFSGRFAQHGPGPLPAKEPPRPLPARAPSVDPITSNTTLSRVASESQMMPRPRGDNLRLIGGLVAAIVFVVIACLFVVINRNKAGDTTATSAVPESPPAEPVVPDAAIPPDAPPTLADVIAASNPMVPLADLHVQQHQVTRAEYAKFLDQVPDGDRALRTPLEDWGTGLDDRALGWVTFDDARAFCTSIHADLPSSKEWTALSGGTWGIDSGTGTRGPLREWTGTVSADGLADVRGGHAKMTEAQRLTAATEAIQKRTEPRVTGKISADQIALATIGFRCITR
jgi:serine/threonine protein kinase